MRAVIAGEVVKVEASDPRQNERSGHWETWADVYVKGDDPTAAADRVRLRVSETTPLPSLGDRIVCDVNVSARTGRMGAYLSVMARALAVEPAVKAA